MRTRKSNSVRPAWETTKFFLITHHYELRKHELTWDVNRFRRLCNALNLTDQEMGAFLRVNPGVINAAVSRNRFPATLELHLTLIERSVFPTTTPPIFPALP